VTLRCECGGVVTIDRQSYGEDMAFESYECANCGDTGTLRHDSTGTTITGCLTRV
jgi:hypothetical protein